MNGFETPPDWTSRALCAQTIPDDFFPDKGGSPTTAKQICEQCDVTTECLTYALKNREPFGVWGGTTEAERAIILRGGAA